MREEEQKAIEFESGLDAMLDDLTNDLENIMAENGVGNEGTSSGNAAPANHEGTVPENLIPRLDAENLVLLQREMEQRDLIMQRQATEEHERAILFAEQRVLVAEQEASQNVAYVAQTLHERASLECQEVLRESAVHTMEMRETFRTEAISHALGIEQAALQSIGVAKAESIEMVKRAECAQNTVHEEFVEAQTTLNDVTRRANSMLTQSRENEQKMQNVIAQQGNDVARLKAEILEKDKRQTDLVLQFKSERHEALKHTHEASFNTIMPNMTMLGGMKTKGFKNKLNRDKSS